MEILDSLAEYDRVRVKPGTVIIPQGSRNKVFLILHDGMAELLTNDTADAMGDDMAFDPHPIVEDSFRIGIIKGEMILGYVGTLRGSEPYRTSIRTLTECSISMRPMELDVLLKLMYSDSSLHSRLLNGLVSVIELITDLSRSYRSLRHRLTVIADSLALGCDFPTAAEEGELPERSIDNFPEYSSIARKNAETIVPGSWEVSLFDGDAQARLGMFDRQKSDSPDIDSRQFSFLRHLITRGDHRFTETLFSDRKSSKYVVDFLDRTVNEILNSNIGVIKDIHKILDLLYSTGGWTDQARTRHREDNRDSGTFIHYHAKFSLECRKDAAGLLGYDLKQVYPVFQALKDFRSRVPSAEQAVSIASSSRSRAGVAAAPGVAKYEGLLARLLEFANMDDGFRREINGLVEAYLGEPDQEDQYPRLAELYWELYESCFLKAVGSDLRGFVPGILLHLGVLDERMLDREDLVLLDRHYAGLFTDLGLPVMTLPFYLEKIYRNEIGPAIDEMGDNFNTVRKQQEKMTAGEKDGIYLFQDNQADRVRFELRRVSREVSGMLYGNRSKPMPFLSSRLVRGRMDRLYHRPEEIYGIVEKYRTRDYSLFHREILLKHEQGSDFIQHEVVPYFVILPGYGSRSLLWQEMDINRKTSAGRIFLPAFNPENLDTSLLQQIAAFRWELQKSVAGTDWTDAVQGGMAGAYYDYITYYKKNPNITPEAKSRIDSLVKRTKSDRERFVHDYTQWIVSEYDGMVKLNPVARDIFYRFCPFPTETRQALAKKPLYGSLEMKLGNRRKKEILKIRARILKYEKQEQPVPPELKAYLEFLHK